MRASMRLSVYVCVSKENLKDAASESHGVVVSTGDSPYNDPGSIPGSGGAVGIWVCYPCGSAASFG